jgi:drug/metabolite transporter (DMT)-like permease
LARLRPIAAAVVAAALFGAGVPLAKVLVAKVEAIPLAALLYLGSGAGLFLLQGIMSVAGRRSRESGIARSDLPWLAGATLAGGVLAPIALMMGLRGSPAATASLLLNLEGASTALLAAVLFREHLGGRTWAAVLLVTGAGMVLSWSPGGRIGLAPAALLVVAACVLWGLDNNLSRHISGKNPVSIAAVKGLVAGAFSLAVTLARGTALPDLRTSGLAMALGFASYGVSIALFIYAMRGLGAARTGALFATAPFIGAAVSFAIFRERLNLQFLIALPVMVAGAVLLLGEHHAHRHVHDRLEHEHRHRHDDRHHGHAHKPGSEAIEHAHRHVHSPAEHEHPHLPDEHHRHGHKRAS